MKKRLTQFIAAFKLLIATALTSMGLIGEMTATIGFLVLDFAAFGQRTKMKENNTSNFFLINRDAALLDYTFLVDNSTLMFSLQDGVPYKTNRQDFVLNYAPGDTAPKDRMTKKSNKPQIKRNLGLVDRIIRFVLSIALINAFWVGIDNEMLGLTTLVLILSLLPTSIYGFCPFYYLGDFSTCKKEKSNNIHQIY
jgi:hypothetical protein